MRSRTNQLEKLAERQRRIQAEIERIQDAEVAQQRKRDAKRKLLVGAVVLGLVERGEWPGEPLMKELDRHLARNHDRALFDLPPRPASAERTAGPVPDRPSREVVA
jgi:hypothetical protein